MRRGSWIALLLVGWARPAYADIVPPPDHECSVEQVVGPEDKCTPCRATRAAPQACRNKLAAQGLSHRCSTAGALSWTEIWCQESDPPPVPSVVPVAATSAPAPPSTATVEPVHASPTEPAAPSAAAPAAPAAEQTGAADAGPSPPPHRGSRGCGACAVGSGDAATIGGLLAAVLALPLLHLRKRRRT